MGKTAIGDFLNASHNEPPTKQKNHHMSLFEIGPDDYLLEIKGKISQDGYFN
jgi:hypothetical protein